MDPYDSDSSGLDDEGDYTETGVLLGYASKEVADDPISHLGGWPAWLDEATPPPGDFANCKVCDRPMLLILELNGDLPEYFPSDERRLYIFGCPRRACNRKPGSIRALRAVRKFKIEEPKTQAKKKDEEIMSTKSIQRTAAPKQNLGASLFGATSLTSGSNGSANPFSSGTSSSTQPANPFAVTPGRSTSKQTEEETAAPPAVVALSETFADKVRLSSPPPSSSGTTTSTTNMKPPPETATGPVTPWPPKSAFPTSYPQYYLDADYETLSRPSTPDNHLPANVTIEPMDEDSTTTTTGPTFESDDLDKAFLRFSTRLAHNPEQVLRYEFRGTPLLYSYTDEVGKRLHTAPQHQQGNVRTTTAIGGHNSPSSRMPRCEYCGSERVFELQLVPHAISVLEEGREGVGLGPKDDSGMEWGTIILGVCGRNCGPMEEVGVVGWREEWAGVQWEL